MKGEVVQGLGSSWGRFCSPPLPLLLLLLYLSSLCSATLSLRSATATNRGGVFSFFWQVGVKSTAHSEVTIPFYLLRVYKDKTVYSNL